MAVDARLIVEQLRAAGRPLKAKELARALQLDPADLAPLREQLLELDAAGVIHRLPSQRYVAPVKIELRSGRLQSTRGGAAFLLPDDAVPDIYVAPEALGSALHGDRVTLRVERSGGRPAGRVVEVLERARTRITGRYQPPGPGRGRRAAGGRVAPDDRKLPEVEVAAGGSGGAAAGDVVVLRITDWGSDTRGPRGVVEEVLGQPDSPGVAILSIIRQYELPETFPPEVEQEAERTARRGITAADRAGREDLRDTLVVTIDPEDARDHDDALSVEMLADGWRVGVHIADVGHYVPEDSELDGEALRRGTSVYLVDRVIPMLPHALSSGLCSLVPDSDRLTLSLLMELESDGAVRSSRLVRGVIRSRHRLNYEQAQAVLDGSATIDSETDEALGVLRDVARLLRGARRDRGSLDLDLPEARLVLGADGAVTDIQPAVRLETHRLVEELMLLANEVTARRAKAAGIPFLYRVHEPPDAGRTDQIREFLATLGLRLGGAGGVTPRDFQRVLDQAEGRPDRALISSLVLRSLKQARYSEQDLGHFGLAARSYTHFTSPIRRYPDLVVHRMAARVFIDGAAPHAEEEALAAVARQSSDRERIAATAERESRDVVKVEFMRRHLGAEMEGTISSVTGFGFFVLLDDVFVEGLVHISSLEDDYYIHHEDRHTLEGERTRRRYRTGDRVMVQVSAVDVEQRRVDFRLVARRAPARGSVKRG